MTIAFRALAINITVLFLGSLNQILGQDITTEQKDISDVYQSVFKIKSKPDTITKHGLGPFYTPIIYPGYALVTGGLIGLVNSVSFYTNNRENAKISTIVTDNVYTQYKQSINIIRSNVWLNHDKINLLGDWRIYRFPTNTYGLGSKTTFNDANAVDYSQLRIYEVALRQVSQNILVGIGYNYDRHWNIKETNYSAQHLTDLDNYGFSDKSVSSGVSFNFQFDNRLNSNNPHGGSYANVQIKDNLTFLGSDSNWSSAIFDFRHYINLSKIRRNILAFWTYNVLTLNGKPPYFDLPTTGGDTFNNTARGYAEGRFKGLNLLYFETEYRFDFTKSGILGGILFTNISSLSEQTSGQFQQVNGAYGMGLRIKLNKKADTNFVIDYGIGTGGSKGFSFALNEMF